MRICIVGYGRAGRVHVEAASQLSNVEVARIVDERRSLVNVVDASTQFDTSLAAALEDVTIEAILVTTPTKSHFEVCKRAIEAGKHVLVEKPIANTLEQIDQLYTLARAHGVLLYTAFNRRHDPQWNGLIAQMKGEYPLCGNVLCRDHPFPPASYLRSCGGIFRDAAIHDIDMLCTALVDTPVSIDAKLDEAEENGSVILTFSRGCRIHMIHSRHAPSYQQEVTMVLADRVATMAADPAMVGLTFQERYHDSYRLQLKDFCDRVSKGLHEPNVTLQMAHMLDRIVAACDESAQTGTTVSLKSLRCYQEAQQKVYEVYKRARSFHTVDVTKRLLKQYAPGTRGRWSVRQVLHELKEFVDVSDPDVDVPNNQHALQTAESIRRAGLPDWLQLVGLIHDLGKVLYKWGNDEDGTSLSTQWSIVGDTFLVGCALPDSLVYPELNALHPEQQYGTLGVYAPGCGLDKCLVSFGHDEYLYQVLLHSNTSLPDVALKIIRYHSLYAWHDKGAYSQIESDQDVLVKGWVKLFNQHDLYSKTAATVNEDDVMAYYETLEQKYLPTGLVL